MSFLERPIGEMDLEELVRLMKQVISQEVPPIPAGVLNLDDLDNPLVPPDGAVQAEALVYNAETGKWENGRITADSLEAELVLAGTIIAGDMDSTHVALGTVEHDGDEMTGLHAFAADGETVTFMLDATGGDIYMAGRVQFGDSYLLPAYNTMELQEQPASGFETPARVQSKNGADSAGSATASAAWDTSTSTGNLLVAHLYIFDADLTVPTPTTPAGWTLAESQVAADSDHAVYVYYIKNAAVRSGTQSITLNDTCRWMLTLYEYSGVDDLDATTDVENVGQTTHGADAITSTQAGLFMGLVNWYINDATYATLRTNSLSLWSADLTPFRNNTMSDAAVNLKIGHVTQDMISPAADTVDMSFATQNLITFDPQAADSIIIMLAFQAKVATATVPTPEAGKLRLYARPTPQAVPMVKLEDGNAMELDMSVVSASVPATPFDGMRWVYRGNLGTTGLFTWEFMYNSSGGTYKWEFIGGAQLSHEVGTDQAVSSSSASDLATDGPTLTLPFAGVYQVQYGCSARAALDGENNDRILCYLYANGSEMQVIGQQGTDRSIAPRDQAMSGGFLVTLASASQVIKMRYSVESPASGFASRRWLHIIPVKVG